MPTYPLGADPLLEVTVFPKASFAVTVTLPATPAFTGFVKPATVRLKALAGVTVTVLLPVRTESSVAVIVWDGVVNRVAPPTNVCDPLSAGRKVYGTGRVAGWGS